MAFRVSGHNQPFDAMRFQLGRKERKEVAVAESLPPLTAEDVRKALNNPTFTVYLYIGEELDRGWEVAQAAFGLLPRLRIYLVAGRSRIPDWQGAPDTKGVVFGFGPEPKCFLTEDQTEDLMVVVDAVDAARRS